MTACRLCPILSFRQVAVRHKCRHMGKIRGLVSPVISRNTPCYMNACRQSYMMDGEVYCSLSPHHVHHGFWLVSGLYEMRMKDRN